MGLTNAVIAEERTDGRVMNGINWIWWTLFAIVWILLAFWPARVAGRKGHSFVGYFLLSLLFFPLALVMAYMVHDRDTTYALESHWSAP